MRTIIAAAFALLVAAAAPAWAGPREEARALYDRFVVAQNAHDFAAVRALLLDSPQFLWVSNGLSIWGPEAAIRRMASFHTAEIWRIEPNDARAVSVEVNAQTAYLHLPLTLVIGASDPGPERFRFLVSALCTDTPAGWRIAALFTTNQNTEE